MSGRFTIVPGRPECAGAAASQADMRGLAVPDFIIGGAPKCGTTTLHYVLDQHPEIGLPRGEIFFFDADDPVTHPDFFRVAGNRLEWQDARTGNAFAWYLAQFAALAGKRHIGEDTTTYLMSEVAPRRIRNLLPNARLIFMLRHPVRRAYSQYWHHVNSGRIAVPLERAITNHPSIILGSTYVSGLRRFLDHFPREQLKVVFFEDMVRDMKTTVDDVTQFLGAAPMTVDGADTWHNRTYYSALPALQRAFNIVGRQLVRSRYSDHLQPSGKMQRRFSRRITHFYMQAVRRLLPESDSSPPMRQETREFLAEHLAARNEGLSKLLGRSVSTVWPDMPI